MSRSPLPARRLPWDLTEGAFPEGLIGFELTRDNTLIAEFPNAVADTASIEAFYAAAGNDRRYREVLSRSRPSGFSLAAGTCLGPAGGAAPDEV